MKGIMNNCRKPYSKWTMFSTVDEKKKIVDDGSSRKPYSKWTMFSTKIRR